MRLAYPHFMKISFNQIETDRDGGSALSKKNIVKLRRSADN